MTGERNTFTDGGCDDCGSLVEDQNGRYLALDYTRDWVVSRFRTDEHRTREIRA